jgi:hypothetical protein
VNRAGRFCERSGKGYAEIVQEKILRAIDDLISQIARPKPLNGD